MEQKLHLHGKKRKEKGICTVSRIPRSQHLNMAFCITYPATTEFQGQYSCSSYLAALLKQLEVLCLFQTILLHSTQRKGQNIWACCQLFTLDTQLKFANQMRCFCLYLMELLFSTRLALKDLKIHLKLQVLALRPLSEKVGHLFYGGDRISNHRSALVIQ